VHEGAATNSDPVGLQVHKNKHLSKYSGGISRYDTGCLLYIFFSTGKNRLSSVILKFRREDGLILYALIMYC
jgi:hypothetical protein